MFNERHSSKQIEDCVAWGLETDAETLADTCAALSLRSRDSSRELCARVRCPTLVIHGDGTGSAPTRGAPPSRAPPAAGS